MEFTISKDEVKKLDALVKMASSVADISIQKNLYILKAESDKLKAVVYGNGNVIEFDVSIGNIVASGSNYFYINISEFIETAEKVFLSSGQDIVKVSVQTNKLTVSAGRSHISKNMLEALSEEEYKEADGAFISKAAQKFTQPKGTLKMTNEIVEFISVIGKFLSMACEDNVTGVCVEGNKVMYFDQALAIIEKKLSEDVSSNRLYISKNHFDFISKIIKLEQTYDIVYSDNGDYILIRILTPNFNALLSMPIVIAEYPTEDEKAELLPPDNDQFEFDIDIETFKMKMAAFEGAFSSEAWRHKEMYLTVEKDKDEANLYFSNSNAEVDTDLPISNLKVNSGEDKSRFKMASYIIYDVLSKFSNLGTDKVHVLCSACSATEEDAHGTAVKFSLPQIDVITSKIEEDEVI